MNTQSVETQVSHAQPSVVRMIIENVCVGEEFALLRKTLELYVEEAERRHGA